MTMCFGDLKEKIETQGGANQYFARKIYSHAGYSSFSLYLLKARRLKPRYKYRRILSNDISPPPLM